jgi:hypothetical protein
MKHQYARTAPRDRFVPHQMTAQIDLAAAVIDVARLHAVSPLPLPNDCGPFGTTIRAGAPPALNAPAGLLAFHRMIMAWHRLTESWFRGPVKRTSGCEAAHIPAVPFLLIPSNRYSVSSLQLEVPCTSSPSRLECRSAGQGPSSNILQPIHLAFSPSSIKAGPSFQCANVCSLLDRRCHLFPLLFSVRFAPT